MRFAALLSALPFTTAYISSITGSSKTTSVGQNFNLIFNTSDYIQTWEDYNAVLGVTRTAVGVPTNESVGQFVAGYIDLVASGQSNTASGSFQVPVFLNQSMFVSGQNYMINAAITSVIGETLMTSVRFLNTTFST